MTYESTGSICPSCYHDRQFVSILRVSTSHDPLTMRLVCQRCKFGWFEWVQPIVDTLWSTPTSSP